MILYHSLEDADVWTIAGQRLLAYLCEYAYEGFTEVSSEGCARFKLKTSPRVKLPGDASK